MLGDAGQRIHHCLPYLDPCHGLSWAIGRAPEGTQPAVTCDLSRRGGGLPWNHVNSCFIQGVFLGVVFGLETPTALANCRDQPKPGVDLSMSDMADANLTGAVLVQANLAVARQRGANLEGADLTKAELGRAVFKGANLDGVSLRHAYIARANFSGVNLAGVNLGGAYMLRTRFEGADLSQAEGLIQKQIEIACGDDKTKLPDGLQRPAAWPCTEDE